MNSTYHFGCIMEGKYDHGCRINRPMFGSNRPMFWFKSADVRSNRLMFWYKSADVLPKTADVKF